MSTSRWSCLKEPCEQAPSTIGSCLLTVALATQNLGRQILWSATEGVRGIGVLHVELAKTEIAQCDVTSVVQQDVLWLQVTVEIGLYAHTQRATDLATYR